MSPELLQMLVGAISGIFLPKKLQRSQGEIYLIGVMLIDHGEPGVWAAFHFSPRRLEPALHDAIVAIIVCALTIHSLALWMVVVCDPPAGIGVPPRPRRASSDPPAAAVAVVPIGDAPGRAVRGDAPPSTSMRGYRGVSRFLVVNPPPGEVRRRSRHALHRRHCRCCGRRPDDWYQCLHKIAYVH
jgi:hypothetical protein